jgi:flagellar motor switch protein FliN
MSLRPEINGVVELWVAELRRSVETSTGKPTTIAFVCKTSTAAEPVNTWRGHVLDGAQGRFPLWVGVTQETLAALSGASGADPGDMFSEIANKASQTFASALGNSQGMVFACSTLDGSTLSGGSDLNYFEIHLLVDGADVSFVGGISTSLTTNTSLMPQTGSHPAAAGLSTLAHARGAMLDRLMELELPLSVALGRATLPIRDVLRLTSGSLIELNRNVGDPVELVVHGTVVAKGEVVAVKGNYGIRVKQIISREDRMALQPRM